MKENTDTRKPEATKFIQQVSLLSKLLIGILVVTLVVVAAGIWFIASPPNQNSIPEQQAAESISTPSVVDGKDIDTGLIAEGDYTLVKTNCISCHNSDLILSAKLTRTVWIEKIRWMQANQKLWDLGSAEKPILDYLEKYYGQDTVQVAFRKPPLKDITWYRLEE